MMNLKRKQRGLASVEFAIVGAATLAILFSAVEMGRMMFTLNALAEATRRGARLAAVCQVNDPRISQVAVFNSNGGTQSPILPSLTTANVTVEYLNEDGSVIGGATQGAAANIWFVRVRIVNYRHTFVFPGLDISFITPEYPTTIPREALGIPKVGQTSTCA